MYHYMFQRSLQHFLEMAIAWAFSRALEDVASVMEALYEYISYTHIRLLARERLEYIQNLAQSQLISSCSCVLSSCIVC